MNINKDQIKNLRSFGLEVEKHNEYGYQIIPSGIYFSGESLENFINYREFYFYFNFNCDEMTIGGVYNGTNCRGLGDYIVKHIRKTFPGCSIWNLGHIKTGAENFWIDVAKKYEFDIRYKQSGGGIGDLGQLIDYAQSKGLVKSKRFVVNPKINLK